MCFIVSIILLILSFNFFQAGSTLLAVGSALTSLFFIVLMIRNIQYVRKLREEKKNDN